MSGVRMLHFKKRLMKMCSNPPILYYHSFNGLLQNNVMTVGFVSAGG